jgi:hypothetical protein
MTNHREYKYEKALLRWARKPPFPAHAFNAGGHHAEALSMLREGYDALPERRRHELRRAPSVRPGRAPPRRMLELLRLVLGVVGLHRWAEREAGAELERLGEAGELETWLKTPPIALSEDVLGAALREGLGIGTDADSQIIDAQLGQLLRRSAMAFTYTFDPRGLPPGIDQAAFEKNVETKLKETVPAVTPAMTEFVKGAMSLDGFLPQSSESQDKHIRDLRFETELTTKNLDGTKRLRRDALVDVAAALEAVRTTSNGSAPTGTAYFEELAFVARRLISNDEEAPIDASGLRQRVTIALGEYVAPDAGGSLSLPSLSAPENTEQDLVSDNIRAVALIYAAWNLEEMKLFQVLDRVVEVFMNGQLPVGFDNGGRALSEYYFDDDDKRLTEAARRMTYSRVLGVPGGEVSREAPPNRAFQDLFLRFLANVAEFERQRRIDDVVSGRSRIDVVSNTGEQVRKSGFDLAANASLYGYGGTFFVAKRLASQIDRALRILKVPEILSAYGVQSPFQVVERVCASDLGGTAPNVVRLRTMADAGKRILDIVGANTAIWPGSDQPLFIDPLSPPSTITTSAGATRIPVDIDPAVQQRLVGSVEQWLAVNGIKDDQRARLGEPEVSTSAPSIPTMAHDGSGGAFDQLKQMVSAGQTPSLDQLKALMPDGGGMVRM